MKKLISVVLCFLTIITLTVPLASAEGSVTQQPQIIDTLYPTEDIVIADINVTKPPYNADNTGKLDATAVIQKAIDDCYANGGGTVWLPAGRYRVTGNIYIKKFVTLRGDYQNPDEGKEYGTIIVADVESIDAMLPSLFTIGASAGAVGLTVWYPGQSMDNVKPYPFTFYVVGNEDYMLHTIKNCTMINSYRGIGASSQCEAGIKECHEMMTIENVRGTCLYQGLHAYNSADVDTVKTLYIANRYWAQAGECFNAPEEEKIDAYTRANGYGLIIGDLEWPEFADIEISDRLYGIHFKKGFRYTFSGSFIDLSITDCDYGIYVPAEAMYCRGKTWGLGIANGTVEGSEYAILHEDNSAIQLSNVNVVGEISCSKDSVKLESYTSDISSLSPSYNFTYQKTADKLYVIAADQSGKTDASDEIQSALDEAGSTGGVAYLPAGLYRLDKPITIPAGVELRGSSSVANRCQGGCSNGTLIVSYYGYDAGDKPLVTLGGDGAGLSGLRIDYPFNNPVDDSGKYIKTSPAVYSNADNIYITNCTITLAAMGVKLEGCDNSFIKKLVGCCIEGMFSLTDCDNCVIEGCLQNGNTLPRNGYENFDIPELKNRIKEENIFTYFFIPVSRITCDYITLDSCENITVFNTFIYGGKSFLNAKDSTGVVVNAGLDGSSKTEPAVILSGGNISFVNFMRSTSDGQGGQNYYSLEKCAKLRSYNSMSVDLLYKERVILENMTSSDLLPGEERYYIFAPVMRLFRFFCKLYNCISQG